MLIVVLTILLITSKSKSTSKNNNLSNKASCPICKDCPDCPKCQNCPTCKECPTCKDCPTCPACKACPSCPTCTPSPPCPTTPPDKVLNWADSVIYLAGFVFDPTQNIYTTRQDALQRLGGYSATYDNLSTRLYMVIDVEPIKFRYAMTI